MVEWVVWGLRGTLGLGKAEGKSGDDGVSGKMLRFNLLVVYCCTVLGR